MAKRQPWVHFPPAGPDIVASTSKKPRKKRRKAATATPVGGARRKQLKPIRALYVVTDRRVVKVGITSDPDQRLRKHLRQGLWKVVYVLHSDDGEAIREFERAWKRFAYGQPHLKVTREELPDGHTEALLLTDGVRAFIDKLVGKSQRGSDGPA